MENIMEKEDLSGWLLSVIPLLASLILHASLGNSPAVPVIVSGLNIFFVSYDYFKNRKTREYPLYIYISGLIFIPLYIYFRTIRDDHRYRFLTAWVVLYVADMALLQMSSF